MTPQGGCHRLLVASLLCGFVGSACAFDTANVSHEDQTTAVSQAIARGTPAPSDSGVFLIEIARGAGEAICSGSLVAPDLILTAGHCATGQLEEVNCETTTLGSPLSTASFRATNEADLQTAPTGAIADFDVAEVWLPFPGALLCGNDLALLRLTEDVPSSVATPLPFPPPPTTGDPPQQGVRGEERMVGVEYRSVGYGSVHPSGTGEKVRRTTPSKQISCVVTDSSPSCDGVAVPGFSGGPAVSIPRLSLHEFAGEVGPCRGDSGGPALSVSEGQGEAILGVLSRGRADCTTSIYSSIDRVELRETLRNHYMGRGETPPEWLNEPGPPPPAAPSDGGAGGDSGGGGLGGKPTTDFAEPIKNSVASDGCACRSAPGGHSSRNPAPTLPFLLFALLAIRARRSFRP